MRTNIAKVRMEAENMRVTFEPARLSNIWPMDVEKSNFEGPLHVHTPELGRERRDCVLIGLVNVWA